MSKMQKGQLRKIKERSKTISSFGGYQFLLTSTQFVVSFLTLRFTSELIWGEVVSILIVVNLFILLTSWGQNTYLLRAFSHAPSQISALWQEAFLSRIILLFPTLIGLAIYYWNTVFLSWILIWMTGAFIHRSFDVVLLYHKKFTAPIIAEIFILSFISASIILYKTELDSLLIIKLYALSAVFRAITYPLIFGKDVFKPKVWQFNKAFFFAAFPFFIPAFIGFLQSRIDLYCIAWFLEKEILGAYQIFIKILTLIFLITRVLVAPYIKNMYRLPLRSLQKMDSLVLKTGALLAMPFTIAIYILIPIVYQIQLSIYMYIIGYLMVLPFFGYVIKTSILIKYYKENQVVFIFISAACINLFCNYFLIPLYGAMGALIATTIVQWIILILCYIFVQKLTLTKNQAHT